MKLYWLDLETTGLDARQDAILEVACSVADLERPFDAQPFYHAVLHCGPDRNMSPYVRDMHTRNGLLDECYRSYMTTNAAEAELLQLVDDVPDRESMATLAGSSIHFDASFLAVHMPILSRRFSHRHYDVSAVKLFCRSLGMPKLPRAEAHRAQADILESIDHARRCAVWLASTPGSLLDAVRQIAVTP